MTTEAGISSYAGMTPEIHERAWVAPGAFVIGDVYLGEGASVWYQCVVRGDVHSIHIGARTNIQDLTMIHVTTDKHATYVGEDVTVGHRAILHGCKVGDRALVGMGAIVLDGAEVGAGSLVGAGALVTPGTVIPPRSVVLGSPGKVVREVTDEEYEDFLRSARHYEKLAERHRRELSSS